MGLFKKKPKPKVGGLALSGGGARGYAHLGALKAFDEAGLHFNIIAGTSAGSIVGALYSAGAKIEDIIDAAEVLDPKEIRTGPLFIPSPAQKIEDVMRRYLGNMTFDKLTKKFACVAVDLIEAKQVVLSEGVIARAVSASCAVPGVFRPVVIDGRHLVDGGVLNTIPSDVVRMMGADVVIAVDVNPTRGFGTSSLGMLDVLQACLRILTAQNAALGIAAADILVSAPLREFSASKKDGYLEMMEVGYNAAKAMIPNIKSALAL